MKNIYKYIFLISSSTAIILIYYIYILLIYMSERFTPLGIMGDSLSAGCKSNPNLDCNYAFPINLTPIGVPSDAN